MRKRKYKILLIVQSVCIIVFILNYLKCTFHDEYLKKSSSTDSSKRDVTDNRAEHGAATVDRVLVSTETSSHHRAKTMGTRGQLSGCTLADIEKRYHGAIVLTTTNTAFLDVTLNMLESIRRASICANVTIIAEDEKAYQYLYKRAEADPAVHVLKTDSGETTSKKLKMFTHLYNQLVNKRHKYLLNLLEQGLEVLFSDADTFWFRDPFPYLQGAFDVAMLDEKLYYPVRNRTSKFCDGFAYYKPTERTIKFVKRWVETLLKNNKVMDQDVLNRHLREDKPVHVDIRSLNPSLFPKGGLFYRTVGWRQAHNDTVVVHSSNIPGHDKKVLRFKENNMWLVNETVSKSLPKT